mmetsp:Transcript_52553/g.98527  ORF Transcript_52553/g.98527 Transcript_52553/m.98527 type:complete len:204 (+) Transcript_52553:117-728(+)
MLTLPVSRHLRLRLELSPLSFSYAGHQDGCGLSCACQASSIHHKSLQSWLQLPEYFTCMRSNAVLVKKRLDLGRRNRRLKNWRGGEIRHGVFICMSACPAGQITCKIVVTAGRTFPVSWHHGCWLESSQLRFVDATDEHCRWVSCISQAAGIHHKSLLFERQLTKFIGCRTFDAVYLEEFLGILWGRLWKFHGAGTFETCTLS